MDLVATCKGQLSCFRVKEIKDVLTHLGLPKQGKKQDLIDRVLALLSDDPDSATWTKKGPIVKDDVAKLVDDTYKKLQAFGATDLAPKVRDSNDSPQSKEVVQPFRPETKVRCVCGSTLETDTMIKCDDLRCNIWQHLRCVMVPEKPEDIIQYPQLFYCQSCRLNRADPFWVVVAHPVLPTTLTASNISSDVSPPVQGVEKTFHITRVDKDLLTKQEYDVQAWCMLLNDKVMFRMQWPQYPDLQVNGIPVRCINRPGSQLLGANGRDDGPVITQFTRDGSNKISLTGCDSRSFCMGVRIVRRRTVKQVLHLIPKESIGECFEDALARVHRCFGGENADDNNDSDIEVMADFFSFNLRCPLSGTRIKTAGRFKPCGHIGCFDLEVFVELNQRSRKWQCPICLKNYSLEHLIIDAYINRITTKMLHCSEEITEIELKPDGCWRVKTKGEADLKSVRELAKWHQADGTLLVPAREKENLGPQVQIKQENISEDHPGTCLKLGIRKNSNGHWEVSKPEDPYTSSCNLNQKKEVFDEPCIPTSGSADVTNWDIEDLSVNEGNRVVGGTGTCKSTKPESLPLRGSIDSLAAPKDTNVIVLSDSDDDNDVVLTSRTAFTGGISENGFPVASSGSGGPPGNPVTPKVREVSALNLFNASGSDFCVPIWALLPGEQHVVDFNLCSDGFNSSHCTNVSGPFVMASASPGPSNLVPDVSLEMAQSNAYANGTLIDNQLVFGREDPSFQIFLPYAPSSEEFNSGFGHQTDLSDARNDDWISLRLGGGVDNQSTTALTDSNFYPLPSVTGSNIDPEGTATSHSSINGGKNRTGSENGLRGPFLFPRQKRSVRPRLCFSMKRRNI